VLWFQKKPPNHVKEKVCSVDKICIPRWHPCVVQVCLTSKPMRTQHKYASSCLVCDLQNVMLSCAPSIDALLEPQFLVALNILEFGTDSERHSNRCSIGMDLCAPQKNTYPRVSSLQYSWSMLFNSSVGLLLHARQWNALRLQRVRFRENLDPKAVQSVKTPVFWFHMVKFLVRFTVGRCLCSTVPACRWEVSLIHRPGNVGDSVGVGDTVGDGAGE
jgi:hypothetical protein